MCYYYMRTNLNNTAKYVVHCYCIYSTNVQCCTYIFNFINILYTIECRVAEYICRVRYKLLIYVDIVSILTLNIFYYYFSKLTKNANKGFDRLTFSVNSTVKCGRK